MNELIEMAKGALDSALKLPTILLLWPAMNVLGWVLKKTTLSNKLIPIIVVPLPAAITPFLLPYHPGAMSPDLTNPQVEFYVRACAVGLVLGFLAWGTHKALLARLEKWLPGFTANGDTTVIEKPPEPKP